MRILWLMLLLLIGSNVSVFAQQQLVFSTIQQSVNIRISEKVLIEAYRRLGVTIKLVPMPGARALRLAASGRYDGELARIGGLENTYPDLLRVPTPVNHLEGFALTRRQGLEILHVGDLTALKIGVRRGIKFTDELTRGMDVIPVNQNDQLIDILNRGRVDAVVMALTSLLDQQAKGRLVGIKVQEPALVRRGMYHYLHKKHHNWLKPLNEQLLKMRNEGLLDLFRAQALAKLRSAK